MFDSSQNFSRVAAIFLAALFLNLPCANAQASDLPLTSPLGLWKTIDDKTGEARGFVRVYQQSQKFYARIEKSATPDEDSLTCTKCSDERKDQPIMGLVIMRGVVLEGGEYRGGDILDPDSGTTYRCKLKIEDGGRRLNVRGYIGVSLVGRSQIWERAE